MNIMQVYLLVKICVAVIAACANAPESEFTYWCWIILPFER